ncbi:MAG: S53 family peptidase [Planctomycetes bacterium]|nr:S53 family peptidase [Planctomycetota bacterium]
MFSNSRRAEYAERTRRSIRRRFTLRVEQLEERTVPTVYTPAQIQHAYGFDLNSNTGAGQTIAIVDAYDDPNIASDLAAFSSTFGLPAASFTKATPQGQPAANSGWATEIALDVEWAHAIAPSANILLVEAASSSYANLLGAVTYAATQPNVSVVSMSWGGGEFSQETSAAYDGVFLNHPGVTFVASSGDSGRPPSWPAISPNVLSVGGTKLTLDANNNWSSETGWGNGRLSFLYGGSGGGISAYEPKPSYQASVTQSSTKRTNPDIAYNADPNTGVYVLDSYNGGWFQVGGTSAGAPQWAALLARANEARVTAGKGTLSTSATLTAVYNLSSADFHDVTSGNNGYAAGPGYDLVTGRGSPKANLVIADLTAVNSSGSFSSAAVTSGTTTTPTGRTPTGRTKPTDLSAGRLDLGGTRQDFSFVMSGIAAQGPVAQINAGIAPQTARFVDQQVSSNGANTSSLRLLPTGYLSLGITSVDVGPVLEEGVCRQQLEDGAPPSGIDPQPAVRDNPVIEVLSEPAALLGEPLDRVDAVEPAVAKLAWVETHGSAVTPMAGMFAAVLFSTHWRNQPEETRRAMLAKRIPR